MQTLTLPVLHRGGGSVCEHTPIVRAIQRYLGLALDRRFSESRLNRSCRGFTRAGCHLT
jgi:hypothetical protein